MPIRLCSARASLPQPIFYEVDLHSDDTKSKTLVWFTDYETFWQDPIRNHQSGGRKEIAEFLEIGVRVALCLQGDKPAEPGRRNASIVTTARSPRQLSTRA